MHVTKSPIGGPFLTLHVLTQALCLQWGCEEAEYSGACVLVKAHCKLPSTPYAQPLRGTWLTQRS